LHSRFKITTKIAQASTAALVFAATEFLIFPNLILLQNQLLDWFYFGHNTIIIISREMNENKKVK